MLGKRGVIVQRHYVREGLTKTAIAEALGINLRTVHRYLSNGKDGRKYSPGLRDRPS